MAPRSVAIIGHMMMIRRSTSAPARPADPLRIWAEEVLGPDLPANPLHREAMIAALLGEGGEAALARLRGTGQR